MHPIHRRALFVITGMDGDLADIAMLPVGSLAFGLIISIAVRFLPMGDPLDVLDRTQQMCMVFLVLGGGWLAWLCFKKSSGSAVARVLRSYVYGALAFAGIYFGVYYIKPDSFSFASNISTPAVLERARATSDDVDRYFREVLALGELFQWVETLSPQEFADFAAHREGQEWPLPSGRRVKFHSRAIAAGEVVIIEYGIVFSDELGGAAMWRGMNDDSFNPFHIGLNYILVEAEDVSQADYLAAIVKLRDSSDAAADSRLRELKGNLPLQFYQADFLYFSFITVTTVGYGDIVPNHTSVRLLVIAQILFGFFLVLAVSQDRVGPVQMRESEEHNTRAT